jgi:2-polyprenyl-6-methoxyphenol hydroxylase-like FAD-dependent oxidoreductase
VDKLPAGQLRDLVASWLTGWAPALRDLVAGTDPATVALVPLRTMLPPLPAWPASRVTLLGDAIHNMTPMAGIGANTALRDADQLRTAEAIPPVKRAVFGGSHAGALPVAAGSGRAPAHTG